jgi:hypothetical protein
MPYKYINVIDELRSSPNPFIAFKVRTRVLAEDPLSAENRELQEKMKRSGLVKKMLSVRDRSGRIPFHPYKKWVGSHWTLALLADLDYPAGDRRLRPLRDQTLETWLCDYHIKSVPVIRGRARRCGSQEGNALYSLLKLGLDDGRSEQLVENLLKWQWPDGGWNCDRKPGALKSSFMETLIPLRALALYSRLTGSKETQQAAQRAATVFLKRNLFKRAADGSVIDKNFLLLHYPCYWHYDILFGLKVIAEAGFIKHPACSDALDMLESKRLADGGYPAESRYYSVVRKPVGSNISCVDWGGTSKKQMNLYVTVDALHVLKAADRLKI